MQEFRFHIVSGETDGIPLPGCFLSNDLLEGLKDPDGNLAKIHHAFPAPPPIQRLIFEAMENSPLPETEEEPDIIDISISVKIFSDLINFVIEGGKKCFKSTMAEQSIPTSEFRLSELNDLPQQEMRSDMMGILEGAQNLVSSCENGQVQLELNQLLEILGTAFFYGWLEDEYNLGDSN